MLLSKSTLDKNQILTSSQIGLSFERNQRFLSQLPAPPSLETPFAFSFETHPDLADK